MFERLRSSRVVLGEVESSGLSDDLTVYLGLYNAASYIADLEHQLRSQAPDFKLIVVDNFSTDSTWNDIQGWLDTFAGRIILARNPLNLGGSGSLYLNSDLITTPWFATLHQDDMYRSNHVSTLAEAISSCDPDVICVITEMGSLNSSGKRQGTPPRASWFLPDTEPATMFLSNLRLHNVPYPAAAFRTDKFLEYAVPWESTAFPDTEWVLKVASVGRFMFIERETMRYRENPSSESHSISSAEKNLGASMALLRVFGAETFHELCRHLSSENRTRFAEGTLSGLDIRLAGSSLLEDVKMFALQRMAFAWGYDNEFANNQLAARYGGLGANFSTNLLESLIAYNGQQVEEKGATSRSFAEQRTRTRHLTNVSRVLLLGGLSIYGVLPLKLRRVLGRISGTVLGRMNRNSPWNFRWK